MHLLLGEARSDWIKGHSACVSAFPNITVTLTIGVLKQNPLRNMVKAGHKTQSNNFPNPCSSRGRGGGSEGEMQRVRQHHHQLRAGRLQERLGCLQGWINGQKCVY